MDSRSGWPAQLRVCCIWILENLALMSIAYTECTYDFLLAQFEVALLFGKSVYS